MVERVANREFCPLRMPTDIDMTNTRARRGSAPPAAGNVAPARRTRDAQLPLGAEVTEAGVRFGVWAPAAKRVAVVIEPPLAAELPLDPEPEGYYTRFVSGLRAGARYRYLLDGDVLLPDPCSRYQPEGPHGPSVVVDPGCFAWTDGTWAGIEMRGQVLYEMHVGAFTAEGTFEAAAAEIDRLRDLGVTALELMPVAEFAGARNWGYDGVGLYAPFHGYGDEHALRRFVDAAHAAGLAVILDVVYNHLGSEGNYLGQFSPSYFTDRYQNDWGAALNFDGEQSGPVRAHFIRNAQYWISEFHLDGLRLDATQTMHDTTRPHILTDIATAARAAAGGRGIVLVAENEPQDVACLLPPSAGGYGLDAVWNDDYHHSARVALTGRRDGYFHDHRGRAAEFVAVARHGFLFQGQYYEWQQKPRGTPVLEFPAWSFVNFTQNHDQVANTLDGRRLHGLAAPARLRAVVALTLLLPQTPMLFMGEEFAASSPFPFFADPGDELQPSVLEGRRKFLSQFDHYASEDARAIVPDPSTPATFLSAKLDRSDRLRNGHVYALYRDLLHLRKTDPVIASQRRESLDAAVLGSHAFLLRYGDPVRGDRLLLVNLGADLHLVPAPEPLLAPPRGARWVLAWSSEHARYGGLGVLDPCREAGWRIPSDSATLLRALPSCEDTEAGDVP